MRIVFEPREMPAPAAGLSGGFDADDGEDRNPASPLKLSLLALFSILGVAALLALGIWQLERRVWKLDLIRHVNERVHAEPVAAPGPGSWAHVNAADDAYRHVRVTGRFIPGHDTLVQAVTELGGGFWLLSPFQTTDGFKVLVNRGFVPPDRTQWHVADRAGGDISLTGLLRVTEPGGGFLRHNDPANDRWYSRDVAAIAVARDMNNVAPYFIDADASANRGFPVGGLTVIAFPNNHLLYALTWFALAAMLAGWSLYALRQEWRLRRNRPNSRALGG